MCRPLVDETEPVRDPEWDDERPFVAGSANLARVGDVVDGQRHVLVAHANEKRPAVAHATPKALRIRQHIRRRIVNCRATRTTAIVQVEVRAAATVVPAEFRVAGCSRWPGRKDCDRACVASAA
jgi:hypothetical protein